MTHKNKNVHCQPKSEIPRTLPKNCHCINTLRQSCNKQPTHKGSLSNDIYQGSTLQRTELSFFLDNFSSFPRSLHPSDLAFLYTQPLFIFAQVNVSSSPSQALHHRRLAWNPTTLPNSPLAEMARRYTLAKNSPRLPIQTPN